MLQLHSHGFVAVHRCHFDVCGVVHVDGAEEVCGSEACGQTPRALKTPSPQGVGIGAVALLTGASANAHDGVESDALLHVFPQVSQEMLAVSVHLQTPGRC